MHLTHVLFFSTKQPPLERRESTMSTASEDSAVAPPGVAVAAESVNGNDDKEGKDRSTNCNFAFVISKILGKHNMRGKNSKFTEC